MILRLCPQGALTAQLSLADGDSQSIMGTEKLFNLPSIKSDSSSVGSGADSSSSSSSCFFLIQNISIHFCSQQGQERARLRALVHDMLEHNNPPTPPPCHERTTESSDVPTGYTQILAAEQKLPWKRLKSRFASP